ncbi:hypothetical protein EJ08DRAFT_702705 [Tothia fuscella]|uniref:Uncharacterized protein n=1 Tax=Tothia fuscella TaxID=1048955 RepID=A0A9P4NFY2_9PEZI|nr:hypothetical protein EJ08DRAFT_702705 [Tothia fuscella]
MHSSNSQSSRAQKQHQRRLLQAQADGLQRQVSAMQVVIARLQRQANEAQTQADRLQGELESEAPRGLLEFGLDSRINNEDSVLRGSNREQRLRWGTSSEQAKEAWKQRKDNAKRGKENNQGTENTLEHEHETMSSTNVPKSTASKNSIEQSLDLHSEEQQTAPIQQVSALSAHVFGEGEDAGAATELDAKKAARQARRAEKKSNKKNRFENEDATEESSLDDLKCELLQSGKKAHMANRSGEGCFEEDFEF